VHGQHHPRADTDHLYVPIRGGGQGLLQIEAACITETTELMEYIKVSEDLMLQVVRTHLHIANAFLPCAAHKCKKKKKKLERKMGKENDAQTVSMESR
jgi:hypothetical protein